MNFPSQVPVSAEVGRWKKEQYSGAKRVHFILHMTGVSEKLPKSGVVR